jgi:hypothetical protein
MVGFGVALLLWAVYADQTPSPRAEAAQNQIAIKYLYMLTGYTRMLGIVEETTHFRTIQCGTTLLGMTAIGFRRIFGQRG